MSRRHSLPALPVPEIQLGSRASSVERWAGVIGGLFLLLSIAGFFWNRTIFFQSYFFSFTYWSGFSFGALGLFLLNNVVGGRWGVTTRSLLIAGSRTMWLALVFLLPVLVFGMYQIYPWTHPDLVVSNHFLAHKKHFLNLPFFWIRTLVYFGAFIFFGWRARRMADQQDADGNLGWVVRMRQFSAPALLAFVILITLGYIDWIMSADTQFYSTVYGAMIMIGDVQQTLALTIIVLVYISKADRFEHRVNSSLLHDLGNLMFAFTIFWTYLSVSQLIIIWPADLPQEISWYVVRTVGGWKPVAAIIAVSMFAIPFIALLSQQRKQNPKRLIRVCYWILGARILDLFWIVEPSWRTKGLSVYWTDAVTFIGLGGIWLYVYLGYLRRRPLLPLHDPRIMPPNPAPVKEVFEYESRHH